MFFFSHVPDRKHRNPISSSIFLPLLFFWWTCSEIFEGLKHCNGPLEAGKRVAVAARITGGRSSRCAEEGCGCENVEREGNKAVKGSLRLWVVQVVKIVFGVFDIFPAFFSCLLPSDSFLSPTTRLLLARRPHPQCPQ